MKSKKDIKRWLLRNAVNEFGYIDLSFIDFGDETILLSGINARAIFNDRQTSEEAIWNDKQKSKEIHNYQQEASMNIWNFEQEATKIDSEKQKEKQND